MPRRAAVAAGSASFDADPGRADRRSRSRRRARAPGAAGRAPLAHGAARTRGAELVNHRESNGGAWPDESPVGAAPGPTVPRSSGDFDADAGAGGDLHHVGSVRLDICSTSSAARRRLNGQPADVHDGGAGAIIEAPPRVLDAAHVAQPVRFVADAWERARCGGRLCLDLLCAVTYEYSIILPKSKISVESRK